MVLAKGTAVFVSCVSYDPYVHKVEGIGCVCVWGLFLQDTVDEDSFPNMYLYQRILIHQCLLRGKSFLYANVVACFYIIHCAITHYSYSMSSSHCWKSMLSCNQTPECSY